MALLSDIDWMIFLGIAGFLLLGKDGGAVVRQMGRYYGRLMRVKQELLSEVSRMAEIPAPVPGRPVSIRQSLLNWEPGTGRTSGIPAAVSPPPVATAYAAAPSPAFAPALGPATWSGSNPMSSETRGGEP